MRGDFAMLYNKMWSIFKKTGNIEAYLYCVQSNRKIQSNENKSMTAQIQMMETTKINSL